MKNQFLKALVSNTGGIKVRDDKSVLNYGIWDVLGVCLFYEFYTPANVALIPPHLNEFSFVFVPPEEIKIS